MGVAPASSEPHTASNESPNGCNLCQHATHQQSSVWSTYVDRADVYDKNMFGRWNSSMSTLLVFAALFTAIVTSFVLDSIAELEGNPNPPPSIAYVNALWSLSITLSLGASTWAMLCQEWCASHLQGGQPGDLIETATKRQRSFQAIKKWKMETVVTSIPLVLHLALFLFLAGLWLRLAEKDRVLGFVVGVPAATIAATYVASTLLPVFTEAPFSTPASDLIKFVLKYLKHPPWFPRIIWPLARNVLPRTPPCSPRLDDPVGLKHPRLAALINAILRYIHGTSTFLIHLPRIILASLPRFKFGGDPLEELNWLSIDPPERNSKWRGRALFWLLQMPLNQDEFSGTIRELDKIPDEGNGYAVDHQSVKSLVLRLSSVLSDGHVSPEEKPVTTYCLRVLARVLDHAFFVSKNKQPITLKNKTISKTLNLFFDEQPASGGSGLEDLVIPLWFCPTKLRIEAVVARLDKSVDVNRGDLTLAVRGLHAAMLDWFRFRRPIQDLPIPDFLTWDQRTMSGNLGRGIFAYLRDMLGELCNSFHSPENTEFLPTLVAESLRILDEDDDLSPTLLNALCAFIVVGRMVNRGPLDIHGSIANAMLESVERKSLSASITEDTLVRLTNKLCAIAYGPGFSTESNLLQSTRLETVFDRITRKWDKDGNGDGNQLIHFIQRFLDAYVSTVQYSGEGMASLVRDTPDANTSTISRGNPERRSPLLHSPKLVSHITESWSIIGTLHQARGLLITTDRRDGTDRAMDTNFFAAAVLGRIMHHRHSNNLEAEAEAGTKGKEEAEVEKEARVRARAEAEKGARASASAVLGWLEENLFTGNEQIRWKGIRLLAELARIIEDIQLDPAYGRIRRRLESLKVEPVAGKSLPELDQDQRLREGLRLCGLEEMIGSIPSSSLAPPAPRLHTSPGLGDGEV